LVFSGFFEKLRQKEDNERTKGFENRVLASV